MNRPPEPTTPQNQAQVLPAGTESHANRIADIYRQGRYTEMPAAFAKAKAEGVGFEQMNRVKLFSDVMDEERRQHKIPPIVRRELEPYMPPPDGQSFERRGQEPR